jgi:glycerol uptake facilitator-like aquaporin
MLDGEKGINFQHFQQEAIGTFVYVFIVCWSRMATEAFNLDFMETAVVTGLIFSILATLSLKMSGGHFNPAVTFTLVLCEKMSLWKGMSYIFAQLIGSFAGASLVAMTTSVDMMDKARANSVLGLPRIRRDYDHGQVSSFIAETCGSAFIMAMYWVASRDNSVTDQLKGYILGASMTVCTICFYNVSGACFNPMLIIGPSFVARTIREFHWIYWFGPLIGMLTTGLLINHIEKEGDGTLRKKKALSNAQQITQANFDFGGTDSAQKDVLPTSV